MCQHVGRWGNLKCCSTSSPHWTSRMTQRLRKHPTCLTLASRRPTFSSCSHPPRDLSLCETLICAADHGYGTSISPALDPALYGLHVSLVPHLRALLPCESQRIYWDYLFRSCHLLVTHFVDLALSLLQLLGLRRWTHGKAGADAYGVQTCVWGSRT